MFMTGTNRALDPGKYFIILTDLLGNGLSSSPSNTPSPFEQTRFPRITIHDNVRLQHQLVTETFGIQRLRLVTGWSMGACQTYQWAAQYPDMVAAACPIAGSARTASFNKVFLMSLRRALELDPAYNEGYYTRARSPASVPLLPSTPAGASRKLSFEPRPTGCSTPTATRRSYRTSGSRSS